MNSFPGSDGIDEFHHVPGISIDVSGWKRLVLPPLVRPLPGPASFSLLAPPPFSPVLFSPAADNRTTLRDNLIWISH